MHLILETWRYVSVHCGWFLVLLSLMTFAMYYVIIIPPHFNEVERGVNWFHVRLSVNRIVSTPYLPQYQLHPFHIYISYQATSEGVWCVKLFFLQNSKIWIFGKYFKFATLTSSCFDLGSDMNQYIVVWVIMGWRRVFSERRHSSCSSLPRLRIVSYSQH